MLHLVHIRVIRTHNFSGDKHWLYSDHKSNYHTITTTMAPTIVNKIPFISWFLQHIGRFSVVLHYIFDYKWLITLNIQIKPLNFNQSI